MSSSPLRWLAIPAAPAACTLRWPTGPRPPQRWSAIRAGPAGWTPPSSPEPAPDVHVIREQCCGVASPGVAQGTLDESGATGDEFGTPDGLAADALTFRIDDRSNTVGWLIWHLTRNQDDHLADAFGADQVWTTDGWAEQFGLPFDAAATGYGQTSEEVAAVTAPAALLLGYLDATRKKTVEFLGTITDAGLDRIVDTRWDPPVTLGVRLISVLADGLQHAGQAAYVKGVYERRLG
jgi:Protein of unknown function (DUF664)